MYSALFDIHCIVLHVFAQVLFWAGNQGNHQNDPALLSNKKLTYLHWNEAKN